MGTNSYGYTATRLLDEIAAQGRSVKWVAAQMGRSRTHLYNLAKGQAPITDDDIAAACRVLDRPHHALFLCAPYVSKSTSVSSGNGRAA